MIYNTPLDLDLLAALATELRLPVSSIRKLIIADHEDIVNGSLPWLFEQPIKLSLIRRLESSMPTLEETGCKIRIGVATGADKVFIGLLDQLDVENERKLPLVMSKDITGDRIEWQGFGVVNPYNEDGSLANLDDYPRFAAYLEKHKEFCNFLK